MFNFTTVVFDGTSPTFYFTNTLGWNTTSSNLFVMFVQCLYPLQDEDILVFQFVYSDKYFISLYHRYVAVSSFRKKDNFIQYRIDQLRVQRNIAAFFKQTPFRLCWFLKQHLFMNFVHCKISRTASFKGLNIVLSFICRRIMWEPSRIMLWFSHLFVDAFA